MKTIALKTVAPTYGHDNKFTGFQTELNARYPFSANGLVMAIANAKTIFARGDARGMELAFSYSETEERVMPMPELFRLMERSLYDLAAYAGCTIDAELKSRRDDRLMGIVKTAIEGILAAHPKNEIEVNGDEPTRDLVAIMDEVYVPSPSDEIDPLHIAVTRSGERLHAMTLWDGGSDHDIFAAYSCSLEPMLKSSFEMIEAFDQAA